MILHSKPVGDQRERQHEERENISESPANKESYPKVKDYSSAALRLTVIRSMVRYRLYLIPPLPTIIWGFKFFFWCYIYARTREDKIYAEGNNNPTLSYI